MTAMQRSPPGSSRPSLLSKLLACEKARARLKDQLSALEQRWRPIGQRVEQSQAEAIDTHKRLKNCIKEENKVASSCAMTETAIRMFRDGSAKLKKKSEHSVNRKGKPTHPSAPLVDAVRFYAMPRKIDTSYVAQLAKPHHLATFVPCQYNFMHHSLQNFFILPYLREADIN